MANSVEITYRACKHCLKQVVASLIEEFSEFGDVEVKPTLIFNGKEDTVHSPNCKAVK
jgi:hypothetical protein